MDPTGKILGVTLLLAREKTIDEAAVRRAAEFAFAGAPMPPVVAAVAGKPAFGIQLGPLRIAVVSVDKPYFSDISAVANRVPDVGGRIAVQQHTSWLSVDCVGAAPLLDETVLGLLGQLAAEFCDETVLGLMRVPRGPVVGYDFSFIPLLRNRKADQVFTRGRPDRVVSAPASNAALAEATAEALRRWPEFVAAFEIRMAGEGFSVKKKFEIDGQVEHMWIDVRAIEGGRIVGRLANQPNILRSLKMGDPLIAPVNKIEDWVYMSGAKQVGGFQAKALESRFHNSPAKASDPIQIQLSHEKLRLLHPSLYEQRSEELKIRWMKRILNAEDAKILIAEHLRMGDSRAALVVRTNPLLVAAYTDEQDAVLILNFSQLLVQRYALQLGTRLLTTNTYGKGTQMASDIDPGPANTGRYTNFHPVIAEFLTDDLYRVADRKRQIAEPEWQRTETLANAILSRGQFVARDGRPLLSRRPA